MVKWADYLISAVSYNPNRRIIEVEVHEDLDGVIGPVQIMDKLTIVHNMRKGKSYVTIYKTANSCKLGEKINLFSVDDEYYLRIDKNRVSLDSLGDIPSIDYNKKKESYLDDRVPPTNEQKANTKPTQQEPEPEPLEPAQLEPEPLEPEPEPLEPAQLEPEPVELSQQELEPEPIEPAPPVESPHGTLPAAGEVDIPFEDIQPEQAPAQPEPLEPAQLEPEPVEIPQQEPEPLEPAQLEPEPVELPEQASAQPEPLEPAPPVESPHGTLPAAGEVDIPFEDIQPEQAPAQPEPLEPAQLEPEPVEISEQASAQPEPLEPAQLEPEPVELPEQASAQPEPLEPAQLEPEPVELPEQEPEPVELPEQEPEPIEPAPPVESPHGTLPAAGEVDIPFEDIQPEQASAQPEPLEPAQLEPEPVEISEQEPEPIEPAPPVESPHGTLPAAGEVDIPFEDIQPEQATAQPEPLEPAQLEPEPVEISEQEPEPIEPAPPVESPHGTLPAAGEVDIPFEDIQPEQATAQPEPLEPAQLEPEPVEISEQEPEPIEPAPPVESPHGTLPAAGEVDIPFEDIQPEQATAQPEPLEPAPPVESPHGTLPAAGEVDIPFEDIQPEQATAQPEPLEPAPPVESPHGTLPAAGEVDIPFEDIQPEEATTELEDEATPEQLAQLEALQKQVTELELIIEQTETKLLEPAPPVESPHGTLPAAGEVDIPFEDIQPEEATTELEDEATPEQLAQLEALQKQVTELELTAEQTEIKSEIDDEATPEQLAQLEALQKQVTELELTAEQTETKPLEPTLPAAGEVDIPFEDIQPEEVIIDSESTPESEDDAAITKQYEKLSDLADQIKELEIALANAPKIEPEHEPETVDGMIDKFDETSEEQIEQLEKLEEHIGEIEDANIESTLIKKLHKQMDRLNEIEERIIGEQEPTAEQIARAETLEKQIAELEAKQNSIQTIDDIVSYCVKCKTKRNMLNPENTITKNNRNGVKGTCSVCGSKMFKIVGTTKKADSKSTKEQKNKTKKPQKQTINHLEHKQSDKTVNGYCMKCRSKQNMVNPQQTTMKNGKPAIKGTCSICSTNMFKIGKM